MKDMHNIADFVRTITEITTEYKDLLHGRDKSDMQDRLREVRIADTDDKDTIMDKFLKTFDKRVNTPLFTDKSTEYTYNKDDLQDPHVIIYTDRDKDGHITEITDYEFL